MPDPERILLVRLSHLGDVVHALPCFHALRERFPGAAIAWAVQPEFAGLLRGLDGLARVVPFDRQGGLAAWPRLRRDLRAFAPDLSVDVQGNWKSALVARASGAPRRVAPARRDWREPSAARLANDLAPPAPPEARHAQDRVLHLARWLCGPTTVRRDPSLSDAERAAGRARLAACVSDPAPPVLVQVSPADDVRTATDACLVDAIAHLFEARRGVVLVAAASEAPRARDLAASVTARTGRAPALVCDSPDLRAFAALLAAAGERGGALVTGDTGPLHLAGAVGLRCVCLSGPYDWRATGPWPSPRGVGDAPAPSPHQLPSPSPHASPHASPHRVLATDIDCRPCDARVCRRPGGRACLEGIDGATVAHAVLALDA